MTEPGVICQLYKDATTKGIQERYHGTFILLHIQVPGTPYHWVFYILGNESQWIHQVTILIDYICLCSN